MKIGPSTIRRVCGAFVAILLVGMTSYSAGDASPAQAAKARNSSNPQYIVVTGNTMSDAFAQAQKQDSKITGCWLQKDRTWLCQAKVNSPSSTTTTTSVTTTIPRFTSTTQPTEKGSESLRPSDTGTSDVTPLPGLISGIPTTQPATTTTTRPPTTTTTTLPPNNPAPSGPVPGQVGPTSQNLTTMNGLTITQNGSVVENVNVIGEIRVKANNVTIRNFRANNVYKEPANTGLLLEDGELHGQQNNTVNGVVWSDYTARRLNIYNLEDGFKAHGNVLIENCWVHDLAFFYNNGSWTHNDGVQVSSGSNVTIRNSRFERIQGTAAVFIKPDQGSISNVTVTNNILGGGAYTLYSQGKNGSNPTDINITNNTFLLEYLYGHLYIDNPNTYIAGNKNINGQGVG